jgi:DnaJ like chaperone protein
MAIWGKLLGTAAGLAIGGPLGALLGAVAGHVYDQWRAEGRILAKAPPDLIDPLDTRRVAFATAVIVLGAKLAKADGVVSRDEVRAFKELFDVDDEDVGGVARIFDEAKRSPEGFEPYARQVATLFAEDPAVLEALLDDLFALAAADGALNQAEVAWLARLAAILGFTQRDFAAILARYGASLRRPTPRAPEPDPYAVLGLTRSASDAEIRAAWRRLVREHHPDRLVAQGVPEEMLKQANARLAAINAAYDRIAKERGIS